MILLLVSLCACTVSPTSFLSKSKVRSLVSSYPEPTAVVTLNYKTGNNDFRVEITYKLLLDKAPLAVTRFIQIAKDGGYDGTLIDKYDSSYKYMVMGRYKAEDSKYYNARSKDTTFAGEFKQNGYSMPSGGYADFTFFSLAMYHDEAAKNFDSANGTLILDLSNEESGLNSANYAVFAEFVSMSVYTNDELTTKDRDNVPGYILAHLMGFTGRTTRTVYDSADENARSSSVQILSSEPTLTVEVFGSDDDWKNLPTIR